MRKFCLSTLQGLKDSKINELLEHLYYIHEKYVGEDKQDLIQKILSKIRKIREMNDSVEKAIDALESAIVNA